jgi:hypothetical protein
MKTKILIIALVLYRLTSFGQSFTLGTAANFLLFTSNGALSHVGSSNLTGDFGTDVGAISGFGTATVNGSFYSDDAVTEQAKIDLQLAYNQLISVPATVTSHAPAFGGAESLVTGVYTIVGAGSLAGNLTINGLGDVNAVFIFRFTGAFAVGAASTVILTNGARPCNVYWVSEGATSIGASTTMKGTIIVNNAAVSMEAGGNLEGRMLTTSGAIAFDSSVGHLPSCPSNTIITPSTSPFFQPDFGSTINFVLFTTNGAVTNSGASSLGLDIGSDVGIITGFGTATVTGTIENANPTTAQAGIDMLSLYNQLITAQITNSSHAPAFGGGETLNSGVYYIGAAGSIAGTLTLDGQGDANSIFIFRINGAFSVGASSSIILLNSAVPCNVFFVAEAAISIGSSSIMKGTFLANNAAVSMASSCDLRGRLFSTTGAINFDLSVATNIDPCTNTPIPLSIELLSFTGECYNQNILLEWSTATETNNDYFSIERSIDGINWQIFTIVDGAGNSSSLKNYSVIDEDPYNDISYYRSKQTDFDGNFRYSTIIFVKKCVQDITELAIYPNPANETLNLSFGGESFNKDKIISTSIYTLLGEKVYYSEFYQSKIVFEHELNGVYFLHVNLDSKNIIQKFVIVD